MVLEFLATALFSLLSLLWSALLFAIPVFLAVWFLGRRLVVFFQKRWHRSWIQSVFLASYAMFFVVLIIAFFVPVWQATRDSAVGIVPAGIAPSFFDLLGRFFFGLVRVLALSAFFSLLALPLVFVGELFKEWFSKRVRSAPVCFFAAVWLAMALVLAIVLFLLPWVVPGLLYLIYWA
jgi:predicted lysophospholipase L1 biosynthesis ABC-type transport system permease subunit